MNGPKSTKSDNGMTLQERLELRRSKVRVYVTYAAAAYIFVGGAVFVAILLLKSIFAKDGDVPQQLAFAKDLYMAIVPLATTVITYWFATRRPKEEETNGDSAPTNRKTTNENETEQPIQENSVTDHSDPD